MPKPRSLLLSLACALVAALALATPASAQDVPTNQAMYESGPSGRFLMGGQWLFRLDPGNQGLGQRFMRQTSTEGWSPVAVPNAWNAKDESVESMRGTVGWYRKDFRLPTRSARYDWVVRFESVNYRSRVWLNGRPVGSNRGAYLPFEVRLPARYLSRGGTNRLVIRIENIRKSFDLPPSGFTRTSVPTGGLWI